MNRCFLGHERTVAASRPRSGLRLAVTLAISSCTGPVAAQSEKLAAELDFAADADCPGQAAFMDEVQARVGRSIQWGSGNASFRLRVRKHAGKFAGHLAFERVGQTATERELTGQECVDVVSGLALVAALALDPNASTAPSQELKPLPRDERGDPESKRIVPSAVPATSQRAPPPRRLRAHSTPDIALLGTLGVTGGPAPEALVGVGMQISVEFSAPLLGPTSISFGPEFAQSGFIGPAGNDAEFTRLTVRAALCPFGLTLLRGVHVHPCVLIDAGTMTAEGRSEAVPVPESIDEAWFATGPGLRFRARPHSSLTLEFLAGAPLAWTQPVYVFTEPRKVVYPVPLLGWTAQIALGLSFGDQL